MSNKIKCENHHTLLPEYCYFCRDKRRYSFRIQVWLNKAFVESECGSDEVC